MNTKNNLILWLVAALSFSLHAADALPALTVALDNFTGEADAATDARNVTTLLTADLTTEANLIMVERADLLKALHEEALGSSGIVSSGAAAKIGQMTGAKIVVVGQVIKTGETHLVMVADIMSTETGRLFADKVEGGSGNLTDLTSQLSHKIAQTISDQATNLLAPAQETSAQRLARIVNSIPGTNRPSVSLKFVFWTAGKKHENATIDGEFGSILMKAGFPVVDDKSERKPDVEIEGIEPPNGGASRQGDLYSFFDVINLTARERRTGKIITVDYQADSATDTGPAAAKTDAAVIATDSLAERLLPLLAQ
jgi:transposase-like protein